MDNYHRHPEWDDAKQDAELLYIEKNLNLCEVEKAKWIYVTAVNVIRNVIRKNSYITTFSSVLQSSKCSVIDIDNLCGLCYQNIESKMTFEFLIETLDSEEKDFLSMFIHGYNYQDLADQFKITKNNARQRLFKIKNKLKIHLPPPINILAYTNSI